jgi:phospholipid transport system transporter-binding protein
MNRAAPEASVRNDTGGTFELLASGNGRFVARGPLTFATARQAREQGLRSLASASGPELEVDCAGITASDSAGLAVLLDWLGAMKRAGRALRYTQLPGGVLVLGRISEVEELLERGV